MAEESPVAPAAIWSLSTSVIARPVREESAKAVAVPMIPPPTMRMSVSSGALGPGSMPGGYGGLTIKRTYSGRVVAPIISGVVLRW
jgi:hypothetical protein